MYIRKRFAIGIPMRLNLKATDITVAPQIRSYLDKKLQSLGKLIQLDDPAVMIDVELGRTTRHHQNGDIFFAEINIHRGKESFRAVADRPDLKSAIDGMRDAIARELSSRKDKRVSLIRRSGQLAKVLLRGGYDGLAYLGRPAQAGLRRLRGFRLPPHAWKPWKWWRKNS